MLLCCLQRNIDYDDDDNDDRGFLSYTLSSSHVKNKLRPLTSDLYIVAERGAKVGLKGIR